MLNLTEHETSGAHYSLSGEKQRFFFLALKHSDGAFILLINVKMPTIVGILTFMSRMNFKLC